MRGYVDDVIISTVKVAFLPWYGDYETAISTDGGHNWEVLEGYNSYDDAMVGHMKYCSMDRDELLNIMPLI